MASKLDMLQSALRRIAATWGLRGGTLLCSERDFENGGYRMMQPLLELPTDGDPRWHGRCRYPGSQIIVVPTAMALCGPFAPDFELRGYDRELLAFEIVDHVESSILPQPGTYSIVMGVDVGIGSSVPPDLFTEVARMATTMLATPGAVIHERAHYGHLSGFTLTVEAPCGTSAKPGE